ncbi:predicted protein [Uncinocarpus reesii 1704]|uniref:Uncharacterized protein n=1 Tax=Uncinocarpus reesii (strain UAMH 1704) TaxID=336963 RepID=C4JSH3_UNCRE|nr:uncharacterized protein UREG_05412 [Uncinocarpus reesii 1704]EEP80570.1 predicted protein [Uncinocarpus reesii 1704]
METGSVSDIFEIDPKVESVNAAAGEELQVPEPKESQPSAPSLPFCDRCHNLVNHHHAQPIPYPPISFIRDIMEESPWDDNHVYHILDAADFPLSLVRNIYRDLDVQHQRSPNRRSKTVKFSGGRKMANLHFVITRADLLGGLKEHVDGMMDYMTQVLRDEFHRNGDRIRLGNVHMVSSYRGWWTKEVKENIWKQGGGVWMVGKANVGKSSLISSVFPKSPYSARQLREKTNSSHISDSLNMANTGLLPPVQEQYDFPVLPIVSALPGTTASPIRIPFGQRKGEIIDLPGLYRGGLEEYVKDEHKLQLIMTKRPKPERLTVKPGQSILLGGLVRITPVDFQDVLLVSPFVSLKPHVTSTEKAIEMLSGLRTTPYPEIGTEGAAQSVASAGVFELEYDVTEKVRMG